MGHPKVARAVKKSNALRRDQYRATTADEPVLKR